MNRASRQSVNCDSDVDCLPLQLRLYIHEPVIYLSANETWQKASKQVAYQRNERECSDPAGVKIRVQEKKEGRSRSEMKAE